MKTSARIIALSAGFPCRLAGLVLSTVCAAALVGPATAADGTAHASGEADPITSAAEARIGVSYMPPPFVGGAKVRTPESTDTLLAESLSEQLKLRPGLVPVGTADPSSALHAQSLDLLLMALPKGAIVQGAQIIPTGHRLKRMAIMRSDTDIKSWEQLKGRTVCVAEGGLYTGTIAPQFGAVEIVYPAPADALLALRVGECDATVHEASLLTALLKFPEWKKFSATLRPTDALEQVLVLPVSRKDLEPAVRRVVKSWRSSDHIDNLVARMAQDIAFEVYLDQTVPDCH